jgi:hypothetical protein
MEKMFGVIFRDFHKLRLVESGNTRIIYESTFFELFHSLQVKHPKKANFHINFEEGFLVFFQKIKISILRSENFAKIIAPSDSSLKMTYMHVQSSHLMLFFYDF